MPGEKVSSRPAAKAPSAKRTAAPAPNAAPIDVSCTHCGKGYRLAAKLAGQTGKCACGTTFRIPATGNGNGTPASVTSPANDPLTGYDPLAADFDYDINQPSAGPSYAPGAAAHSAPVDPVAYAPAGAMPPASAHNPYGQPPAMPGQGAYPPAPGFGAPNAYDPLGPAPGAAMGFSQAAAAPPAAGGYWNQKTAANPYSSSGKKTKSRRSAYKKSKKSKRNKSEDDSSFSGIGNIGFGLLLTIGSAAFTFISYTAANPGEEYYILYGPFIWGCIHLVAGIVQVIAE